MAEVETGKTMPETDVSTVDEPQVPFYVKWGAKGLENGYKFFWRDFFERFFRLLGFIWRIR